MDNGEYRLNRNRWRKLLDVLFFVMMGFGLYLIVARYGIDQFYQSLDHISPGLVLSLISLNVAILILSGLRLMTMIETVAHGLNPNSILKINLVALASNYASIGKVNAPIKAILLRKFHKVPFSASTPVIVAEQAFDFVSLIVMFGAGLALAGPFTKNAFQLLSNPAWTDRTLLYATVIIFSVGIFLLMIILILRNKISAINEMIHATLKLFANRKTVNRSIFYTICISLCNIASVACALHFLKLDMTFGVVLLLLSVPLVAGLFTPTPGGLGAREVIFAGMYALCYGAGGIAVLAAILLRISFFISLPIAFFLIKCL